MAEQLDAAAVRGASSLNSHAENSPRTPLTEASSLPASNKFVLATLQARPNVIVLSISRKYTEVAVANGGGADANLCH